MSNTVAIIAEYNPFHNGHKYHIDKIREELGEDTAIIAIMSGNYTQRAEVAFADKLLRACAAVDCGVNLVLELPFPFSSSSAELFASAGVSIADKLGVVDYLSFGSEIGNCDSLYDIATKMLSPEFTAALSSLQNEKAFQSSGFASLTESVYRSCFSYDGESFTTSNNILALEYIKALIRRKSTITPHTMKRIGATYNEEKITDSEFQSATAIRRYINDGDVSAFNFMPKPAKKRYLSALNYAEIPCNYEKLSSAFISFFRLNSASAKKIHDAEGGLYKRLVNLSFKTNSISSLTELAATKKYTLARIRRAILFSFFGVTSSDVKTEPCYTQVLAMDSIGAKVLKEIKKKGRISIITKPSATKSLDNLASQQKAISDAADSVFQLTKPRDTYGCYHMTFTPYIRP